MKILLILLLLCVPVWGQKPPKELEVTYDKFNDRTTVTLDLPIPKSPGKPRGILKYVDSIGSTLSFEFNGTTLTRNAASFHLAFFDTCRSYHCFSDVNSDLIFLIDGKRFVPGDSVGTDSLSDIALYRLTRSELESIVTAKTLEAKVGSYELIWNPKELAAYRALFDFATVKELPSKP